jgi:hypothetical protein
MTVRIPDGLKFGGLLYFFAQMPPPPPIFGSIPCEVAEIIDGLLLTEIGLGEKISFLLTPYSLGLQEINLIDCFKS